MSCPATVPEASPSVYGHRPQRFSAGLWPLFPAVLRWLMATVPSVFPLVLATVPSGSPLASGLSSDSSLQ